jgi:hypothetical protein
MNLAQFENWKSRSNRGDRVVYFIGLLMKTRQHDDNIDALAKAVWDAYERGVVKLVQERVGPNDCAYWAVRT